jgi:GT2 family glycosyltransferase
MIAFGVAVADEQAFERWAARGIARVSEPDSVVLTRVGASSIQAAYNSILDEAARCQDLEAVVLLHEDTEIVDDRFLVKVRNGFADPTIAVIGPVGGSEFPNIAWWAGRQTFGRLQAPNVATDPRLFLATPYGWHRVEALDGLMLVLSPWAAREVRFDRRFAALFHGYDIDYCFEVRARGRDCVVAPLHTIHHTNWKPEKAAEMAAAAVVWERKWGRGRPVSPAPTS